MYIQLDTFRDFFAKKKSSTQTASAKNLFALKIAKLEKFVYHGFLAQLAIYFKIKLNKDTFDRKIIVE